MKKNIFGCFFFLLRFCVYSTEKELEKAMVELQKLSESRETTIEEQDKHILTLQTIIQDLRIQITEKGTSIYEWKNEADKWQNEVVKLQNQNRGKMDRYASIGLKFTTMVLAGALVWHFWIREILYPSKPIILPNPYRSAEKVSKTPDSTASHKLD